jgi:putative NIF3 family GTP cyclohydrolase 1 type 2
LRLKDIHQFFVAEGVAEDLRRKDQIKGYLSSVQKRYRLLSGFEKKFFDKEDLTNPYADTRILCGDLDRAIKNVFVGVDVGVGELLLVDRLVSKGEKVDLVIAHHPLGTGLAGLGEVMGLQAQMLEAQGLDKDVAQKLMKKRIDEVDNSVHGENHFRVVDAAKALDLALMCCHTPADNHVTRYLQQLMDKKKPLTLKQVVDLLLKEPEYKMAAATKTGPRIVVGRPEDKAGKIVIDMTGGTEGSKEVFARLSQAGVKTLIGMHMSENHLKEVKNEYINVIIAGHIASDNLGLNLLLDKLSRKIAGLHVVEGSGFRRVRR